jgi:hypothetical protein
MGRDRSRAEEGDAMTTWLVIYPSSGGIDAVGGTERKLFATILHDLTDGWSFYT